MLRDFFKWIFFAGCALLGMACFVPNESLVEVFEMFSGLYHPGAKNYFLGVGGILFIIGAFGLSWVRR